MLIPALQGPEIPTPSSDGNLQGTESTMEPNLDSALHPTAVQQNAAPALFVQPLLISPESLFLHRYLLNTAG